MTAAPSTDRATVPAPLEPAEPGRQRPRRHRRVIWPRLLSSLLVLVGLYLRVRQWAGGRSLWLDEALLAPNLTSRSHLQLLTQPLLHAQAAPQVWLQLTRLSVELFGTGERSLRLVSLLAGCAALVLVRPLGERLLEPRLVPVAVGLCALHPGLVYWSDELKPYGSDVLVVLVVVLVALRDRPLRLGLVGAVAVWCAFPAVFVLAGASVLLVLRRRTLADRARAVAGLAPWLVSLAVAYVVVLAPVRSLRVFADYWGYAYPRSTGDLPAWLVRQTLDLVREPLRLAVPVLALALLAVGLGRLLRRAPHRTCVALAGVPFAVLAGALSAYPLTGRLDLWTVPLAALLLAAAVPARRGAVAAVTALALAVVAGPAVAQAVPLAVRTQHVEELRPVLEQVARERQPGDVVLVDIAARAAFDVYGPPLGLRADGVVLFSPEPAGGCADDVVALRTGGFGDGRVWLVMSHDLVAGSVLGSRADLLSRVGDVTRLVQRVHEPGAEAVLLQPGHGGRNIAEVPPTPGRCLLVVRSRR